MISSTVIAFKMAKYRTTIFSMGVAGMYCHRNVIEVLLCHRNGPSLFFIARKK